MITMTRRTNPYRGAALDNLGACSLKPLFNLEVLPPLFRMIGRAAAARASEETMQFLSLFQGGSL